MTCTGAPRFRFQLSLVELFLFLPFAPSLFVPWCRGDQDGGRGRWRSTADRTVPGAAMARVRRTLCTSEAPTLPALDRILCLCVM